MPGHQRDPHTSTSEMGVGVVLEYREEVEMGEQDRWCLWSHHPSVMDEPAAPENPVTAETGTCDSSLPVLASPVATGNQAAVVAGFIPPVTAAPTLHPLPLTCSPWRQQLQTRQRCPQRWFPTLSSTTLHHRSSAQDPGSPRCHRGTHHPSRTGGNISSRKAHANLEAQAARRVPATSCRGGGRWEVPIFKYCQRQLRLGWGWGCKLEIQCHLLEKRKASTYQFAELLEPV